MPAQLSRLAPLLTTAGTCYSLIRFAPSPGQLGRDLAAPHSWLDRAGTDLAACQLAGALLWLASLWLAVGLLASYLSALPGWAGRLAGAVARRAVPAAVYNLVAASAGASLLFSPLAALASPLPGPTAAGPTTAGPTTAGPTAAGPTAARPATTQPALNRAVPNQAVPNQAAPGWPLDRPLAPTTDPQWPIDPPAASKPKPTPERPPATGSVTVTANDSLWTITAEQLGPAATDQQIAIEWPYWYRANRAVIGSDPNLLRPGTTLRVPDHSTSGPATSTGH